MEKEVHSMDTMKKCSLFLMFSFLCSAIVLIAADELFSQRGMKITVRTKTGKEIPLYKDSYALIVGNGAYTNGWDPLEGGPQDAAEVAAALETHGFVVTLKTDLTKDAFETTFAEFVLNAGQDKANRLLFYYAGHGYTQPLANDQELGYLVMVDAPNPETDKVGFETKSVNMEGLVTKSKQIQARHALFVFDSCFSGTILNVRDRLRQPESISDSVRYPVRQFITAGRAGEVVPDKSVFKQTFLNLIEGRVPEPFPDGYITGEELGFYLKNQVPVYNSAQHPQYGKIRDPKLDQGDFVFVLGNTDTPEIVESLSTTATLRVTSTPSGATVYLDGNPIGSTPLSNHQIDTGVRRKKQVEVGLELPDYKSQVARLTLKGGDITPWDVQLKKIGTSKHQTQTQSSPKPAPPNETAPDGMVLIPAGEFKMGSNEGSTDEKPVHTVYVDAFYIDKYEVTNAQYKKFIDENPEWNKARMPDRYYDTDYLRDWEGNNYPRGEGDYPVVHVNWYSAMAYSIWVGKRLPTEAEWEKAARGGLIGKRYTSGNRIDFRERRNSNHVRIYPVGRFVANDYGLYDMEGNAWEWCLDAYQRDFYARSPRENPLCGENIEYLLNNYTSIDIKSLRVVRGGSPAKGVQIAKVAQRLFDKPREAFYTYGFRCVKAVTP